MATLGEVSVDVAVESVLEQLETISFLKKEQREALIAFVGGKDVCAFLPTGFGKSLIYQLAPLVVKELGKQPNPIVIVVSPLVALMEDQVNEATKLGVTAVKLGDNDTDVLSGKYQLVFGSPESWLLNSKWRDMLASKVYQENLVGVVVDEVHATYKWGEGAKGKPAFRESLRSIVREEIPVLALTASAEIKHRNRVTTLLHMEAATQVTVSPNRTNIRLGLCPVSANNLNCLDWIVKIIRDRALSMSPVIIYCRSLKNVGKVFCYLKAELGEGAWANKDTTSENLLIGMFHSKTLQQNKERVLKSLNGEGHCRVVVATTALGMGLNFPNVSHVVMYGSPEDVEAIVQQVGRAGRHGLQSHAILYVLKHSPRDDIAVKEVIAKARNSCFRQALYTHFEADTTSVKPGHLCCTFCHSQCACEHSGCSEHTPTYENFEEDTCIPAKCREVTSVHKQLLQELLEDYMSSLGNETEHLFISRAVCTGFSTELIVAVLEHCAHIFDIDYIVNHLPVFRLEHGREILLIISEVFGDIEYVQPTSHEEAFIEPDIDYMGYFDEEDEAFDMATQHSSQDSDTWYN